MSTITEAVMERIAEAAATKAAKETVQELFKTLGVDTSSTAAVLEVQKDFAHLRETRLARLAIKSKAVMTMVGIFTTGAVTTLYFALKGTH